MTATLVSVTVVVLAMSFVGGAFQGFQERRDTAFLFLGWTMFVFAAAIGAASPFRGMEKLSAGLIVCVLELMIFGFGIAHGRKMRRQELVQHFR